MARLSLYGLIGLLYGSVALMSYGFDDEFFNIKLVEQHGMNAFRVTQQTDVHPPLSYLLNALIYEALGDWSRVRIVSALMLCLAIFRLCEFLRQNHGSAAGHLALLLLASNPALLLWGTSLRWYAYFLPVVLWLLVIPRNRGWPLWLKLAFGLVILGYTGYVALLIAPALVLLYWSKSTDAPITKLKRCSASLVGATILYIPQLAIFSMYHLPNRQSQTGTLLKSIAGFFVAQISNQGVFPSSTAAILGTIGTLIIFFTFLRSSRPKSLAELQPFVSYVLFCFLLSMSGLAAKFRNFVVATPLQAVWFASLRTSAGLRKTFLIGVGLVLAGNAWGVVNVFLHRDTTKNSWNLPVREVLAYLQEEYPRCDRDVLVFSHDPTLAYHLERLFIPSTGIYARREPDGIQDSYRCVFVLTTFAGSIPAEQYDKMMNEVNGLRHTGKSVLQLQADSYYRYKSKIDRRYPPYAVTIVKFENASNVKSMATWRPSGS